jgi:hypothetical protein
MRQQTVAMIQPNLSCLRKEVRIYYLEGIACKAIVSERKSDVDCARGLDVDDPAILIDLTPMTVGDSEDLQQLLLGLPAMQARDHHTLSILEQQNGLVSNAHMYRVDHGVEIQSVKWTHQESADLEQLEIIAAEFRAICNTKAQPAQWTPSGRGWIMRSFINEVSRMLDCARAYFILAPLTQLTI